MKSDEGWRAKKYREWKTMENSESWRMKDEGWRRMKGREG